MLKTLRLSFALRNTYRVNAILYGVRQIPLVKKILPETLYRIQAFKIIANILTVCWEVLWVFLGKILYVAVMIAGAASLYDWLPTDQVFLHILLFLTVIGSFANTGLFNPTRDKYYAMILLRMDAREYSLVHYGYMLIRTVVGFLPVCLIFGRANGVALWLCLLTPFSVAGIKAAVAGWTLYDYERRGVAYNENKLKKWTWALMALLLACAYGLPLLSVLLPVWLIAGVLIACIPAGAVGLIKVFSFGQYRQVNQELLAQLFSQQDLVKKKASDSVKKAISSDMALTSHRSGFEGLNELFIKRHRRILWRAAIRITVVFGLLVVAAVIAIGFISDREAVKMINRTVQTRLPYFVFIMYAINRGSGFTTALFVNCDQSLLTYSFFKEPANILRLFRIRLREIIKINALPALVIGVGLDLILYASGGTKYPVYYAVLVVSVICMSLFFSVHYLTIYYLLQPYNIGTEIRSGTYRLVLIVTYVVCFAMIQIQLPLFAFGLSCIAFCVLYMVLSCLAVYRFAGKTFRLRL